jgi:hypothetical protein
MLQCRLLLGILLQKLFCRLSWFCVEPCFQRRECGHPVDPKNTKSLAKLAPCGEQPDRTIERHDQRTRHALSRSAIEVLIGEPYFALVAYGVAECRLIMVSRA